MKADRKRLKGEKTDLVSQMQQLYATLESREEQLRDFIRNYEQHRKVGTSPDPCPPLFCPCSLPFPLRRTRSSSPLLARHGLRLESRSTLGGLVRMHLDTPKKSSQQLLVGPCVPRWTAWAQGSSCFHSLLLWAYHSRSPQSLVFPFCGSCRAVKDH